MTKEFQIIDTEVVNTATAYSDTINMHKYSQVGIAAIWTGSGTGTISLEVQPHKDAPWNEIADSSQTISAAGDFSWDVETSFMYVRVKVVESGGSNLTVDAWASAKHN